MSSTRVGLSKSRQTGERGITQRSFAAIRLLQALNADLTDVL